MGAPRWRHRAIDLRIQYRRAGLDPHDRRAERSANTTTCHPLRTQDANMRCFKDAKRAYLNLAKEACMTATAQLAP
jgi:hypothetical protein